MAARFLNYVFMDVHNGLSERVLLLQARSGNCGRGGLRGERDGEAQRGRNAENLRLNQRRVTNCMK